MSNVGKSALLQLLADPDVWTQELGEAGREFFPVYVDCNRMLGLTEQGFCELVLRCLQESSAELAALPELTAAYNTVVAPGSDFQVPLELQPRADGGPQADKPQDRAAARRVRRPLYEYRRPRVFEPAGGAGPAQQPAGVCDGDGPAAGRAAERAAAWGVCRAVLQPQLVPGPADPVGHGPAGSALHARVRGGVPGRGPGVYLPVERRASAHGGGDLPAVGGGQRRERRFAGRRAGALAVLRPGGGAAAERRLSERGMPQALD